MANQYSLMMRKFILTWTFVLFIHKAFSNPGGNDYDQPYYLPSRGSQSAGLAEQPIDMGNFPPGPPPAQYLDFPDPPDDGHGWELMRPGGSPRSNKGSFGVCFSSTSRRSMRPRLAAEPQIMRVDKDKNPIPAGAPRSHGYDADGTPFNPFNKAVAEAACDNPNIDMMSIRELCSMPPDKGTGADDIIRYYFNPIVQQCIPFSYSGLGGNPNRFLSVKNCYLICHPAETTVKKPKVVGGIRAYLVPVIDFAKERDHAMKKAEDVVIRTIPNPADPSKTLTIVQNAKYVYGNDAGGSEGAIIDDGSGTTRIMPTKQPNVKIIQRVHHRVNDFGGPDYPGLVGGYPGGSPRIRGGREYRPGDRSYADYVGRSNPFELNNIKYQRK